MKIERDERKFDFHGIGLAIKKAREREGMTQKNVSTTLIWVHGIRYRLKTQTRY